MATPTQTPPDQDEFTPGKSPGDDYWERETSRYDTRHRQPANNPSDPRGDNLSQPSGDSTQELAEQERRAASGGNRDEDIGTQESRGDATWEDNVKEMGPVRARGGLLKTAAKVRTVGGFLAIIGLTFSIAGIMISLLTGALGLINLKETALGKMSQAASNALENRSIKIMTKKMAGDLTSGCTIKIKCRYRGMSEREIKRFNQRALKSGSGVRVVVDPSRTTLNPRTKGVTLVTFDPADLSGSDVKPNDIPDRNVRTIPAGELRTTLRSDPLVRKSVRDFYKSKVEFYSGQAAKSVWTRTKTYLGKRKTGAGEGDTEEKRQQYRQREMARNATSGQEGELASRNVAGEAVDGETEEQKNAREEADRRVNQVNSEVRDVIQAEADVFNAERDDYNKNLSTPEPGTKAYDERYKAPVDKIANAGGGALNTVGLGNVLNFMQNVCLVRILVGAVDDSRVVLQAVQLMQYGLMFGTLADRIKAGDADGDTTQQIGDLMAMLNSRDSEGFTAFDSFGYNWVSNGSVRTSGNEDVGTYQNGGTPPGILGPVVGSVVNMGALKSLCGLATSPAGVAIGIGLTVAGLFSGGAATAVKTAAKQAIEEAAEIGIRNAIRKAVGETASKQFLSKQVAKDVAGTGVKLGTMEAFFRFGVPPLINSVARAMTRTVVTGDEKGRSVGNAIISGFGVATSQVGKAQGFQPMSIKGAGLANAVAYENQLKIAKEEGVNQFDISNEFSFANKFATLLAPNTARLSSISSLPSMIASIPGFALQNAAGTAQAATDPEAQFKYCKDDRLKDAGIAGDPFCNPQYGIDPVILNSADFDPEAVVSYLYDNGLIDEEGSPIGDFETFIKECMQTDAPLGNNEDCTKKVDSSVAFDNSKNDITSAFLPSAKAAGSVTIPDDVKKVTMMRMYCTDSSIDADMNDGEDVASCSPKTTSSTPATPDSDPGGPVSDDAKVLAQQILDNPNVTYPYHDEAQGLTVKEVLEEVVKTGKGIVNSSDVSYDRVAVNPKVLQAILEYAKDHPIGLNALTNADHSSTSNHYKGIAIDIACSPALDRAAFDAIAAKYNGKNNGEVCPGNEHWHYDFPTE